MLGSIKNHSAKATMCLVLSFFPSIIHTTGTCSRGRVMGLVEVNRWIYIALPMLCTPTLIHITAIKHRARALFDRCGINPTVQS